MQKWEYLYINRWKEPLSKKGWRNIIITSTGEKAFMYKDMAHALAKLGDEGWELTCVTALSSSENYPGFSNGMVLYFKRPKE
jgi:hypothetical protein